MPMDTHKIEQIIDTMHNLTVRIATIALTIYIIYHISRPPQPEQPPHPYKNKPTLGHR